MRSIIKILLITLPLFGGELVIQNDSVELKVNGDEYNLQVKEKLNFIDGSTICYIKGYGQIIINNTIKLTSHNKDCIQTSVRDKSGFNQLLLSLKDSFIVSFSDVEENIVDGISSKGKKINNDIQVLNISKKQTNIVLHSDFSGPLPMTLNIINSGKITQSIVNKDDDKSIFILKVKQLNHNDILELRNGFGVKVRQYRLKMDL